MGVLAELYSGWPGAPELRHKAARLILEALDEGGWHIELSEPEDANQAAARTVRQATEGK